MHVEPLYVLAQAFTGYKDLSFHLMGAMHTRIYAFLTFVSALLGAGAAVACG